MKTPRTSQTEWYKLIVRAIPSAKKTSISRLAGGLEWSFTTPANLHLLAAETVKNWPGVGPNTFKLFLDLQKVYGIKEKEPTLEETMLSMRDKLKKGLDGGPFGDNVILTPAEATIAYRLLFERQTEAA